MPTDPNFPAYFYLLTPKLILVSQFLASIVLSVSVTTCTYGQYPDVCMPVAVFVSTVMGNFTGPHLNAMLSICWLFKAKKTFPYTLKTASTFIGSQLMGGFVGGVILHLLYGQIRSPQVMSSDTYWLIRDLIGEIIVGLVYTCIIHIISNSKTSFCDGQFLSWTMGAVGVLMARQLSPHSGGCMNPSLAVSLNLSKSLMDLTLENFTNLYVYILGPITGAILGTLYFDYVYLPNLNRVLEEAVIVSQDLELGGKET